MSEVVVEVADPTSADVQRCLRAYFDELPTVMGIEVFIPDLDPAAEASLYLPPVGVCLLARIDGVAVGTVSLARLSADVGEVKRMWLAPSARGRGIGRALLSRLHQEAAALAYRRLRLDTHGDLIVARSLYTSFGYVEIPRYNDNPYAQHWYEAELDPAVR